MKKTFPSFDSGIDNLFPSDPWKESKRKKNNSALHESMLRPDYMSRAEIVM